MTIFIIIMIIVAGLTTVSAVKINENKIETEYDANPYTPTNNFGKYAVVISGGVGGDPQHHTWANTGLHAKNVFQAKGYTVEFLDEPTENQVNDAISNIHASKVCLYLVDHGTSSSNPEKKGMVLNRNFEILTPNELRSLVNTISADTITIVIDICHAGMFIPALSGKDRVIITSSDSHGLSFTHSFNLFGETFFSKIFLDELEKGKSYGEAWEETDNKMDNPFYIYNLIFLEMPLIIANAKIDDNGDGIGSGTFFRDKLENLKDGDLAKDLYP